MLDKPKNDLHERERARRETVAEREWMIRNQRKVGPADLVLPTLAMAVLFFL